MTGAWLLKLLEKSKTYYEYYASKRNDYPQGGWVTFNLTDLAAFIDNYFLPRPLYGDETPVKVGDIFLPYRENERSEQENIIFFYVTEDGGFSINGILYNKYQRVMKPEKKIDSWEQLEKDISAGAYDYCGTVLSIDTRKTLTSEDNEAFAEDIIRRAKELAKGDSE